jgi:hypothetical protein
LLALELGIVDRLSVFKWDELPSLRIRLMKAGVSAQISPGERAWEITMSRNSLGLVCQFLVEVVVGAAQVDHVHIEADDIAAEITWKLEGPFETVDGREARRRLGLQQK